MITRLDGETDPEAQAAGDRLFATVFFTPEGFADPIPSYAELHRTSPVHLSAFGGAILSRHDHARELLRDDRFGKGEDRPDEDRFATTDPEVRAVRQEMEASQGALSMLRLDPPDHTRQRRLVSRAFTPRTVEKLRPRITEQVERYLDALAADGGGDLMDAIATPLPVSVISEMLGVPASDWPTIREPVTDLVASLEPGAGADDLRASMVARDELAEYFIALIAQRTADPQDDLLSALIAARDEDDQLSDAEVLSVAILLFAAGAETTTNLIGNGMNALLDHPDEMARLWGDPSLVPAAVEEILRYDSPVQLDGRMCLQPAEFAGLAFEEGDRVLTLLGAANHDPAVYDDPDRFDVGRFATDPSAGDGTSSPAAPVMSFGSGIHYCLGANLARVEGQEVFAGLIRRFDSISADGGRRYRQRMVLRGLETCPVAVRSR